MVSCYTHVTQNEAHYDPVGRTIDSYGIENVSNVDLPELGTSIVLMWITEAQYYLP